MIAGPMAASQLGGPPAPTVRSEVDVPIANIMVGDRMLGVKHGTGSAAVQQLRREAELEMRRGQRAPPAAAGPALNCTELVSEPIDVHPVRSPQEVHSFITRHLTGRSLVEIGTRNGDGMSCFARAARSSVAVEMDPTYCAKLEQRARVIGGGRAAFAVHCDRYQSTALDADVFTWWQQSPHLKNVEVLQHLRRQQKAGSIRPDAMAIVLYEVGYPDDMRSFLRVRNISTATAWSETVPFDESALCKRRMRQRWFHTRARGSFHVVGIRLADVI